MVAKGGARVRNERQIDLPAQVERVKRRTRPWKSIIALLLAIAAAVISHQAYRDSPPIFSAANHTTDRVIAVQQALGNVFAGLVLLFARPFQVGDAIRLQAGALGGTLEGTVTDIGSTYVRVEAEGRMMSIPNSQVLNAVVGPIPPAREDPAVIPDGRSGTPGGPEQPLPHPAGPA